MRVDASAYSALGLRPGAPRAEVDQAYRRLIKLHHPDRNGGDGSRAAEINRAYTSIRQEGPAPPAGRFVAATAYPPSRRARASRRPASLLLLVVALGVGAVAAQDGRRVSGQAVPIEWSNPQRPMSLAAVPGLGGFDEPLHGRIIEAAIGHASDLHSLGDTAGALEYSRDCHNRLRADPNMVLFDACAAFDESTVTLGGGGAAMDSGPFSGSAVMAREMAAARALSDDMLGADSRLHQIRSRVEMALLPKLDAAAGQQQP